jgi:hypothetical protein
MHIPKKGKQGMEDGGKKSRKAGKRLKIEN